MENKSVTAKLRKKGLHALQMFIGKWQIEGENFEASETNTSVTGEATYEWMPGNFFVINMWDREFDKNSHKGIGILGYDTANEFSASNFDNLGFSRVYKISVDGNIWKFSGETERALIEFSSDGESFIENWEVYNENEGWKELCILKATKV